MCGICWESISTGSPRLQIPPGPGDTAVSVDGGLSNNSYFVQFLANALGRPLRLQSSAELSGLGTAQLALDALGLSVPGCQDTASRTILPNSAHSLQTARDYFRAAVGAQATLAVQRPELAPRASN